MKKLETLADLSARVKAALQRAARNFHYEVSPEGVLFPKERLLAQGLFVNSLNGGPLEFDTNLVVVEGRNHILDTVLHNQAPIATWYIALFSGDVTPQPGWTAANFVANATEFIAYDEANRVAYNEGAAAAGVTSNFDNKAEFTVNAAGTIRGGALISASAKSATTGKLLSAARFTNDRNVEDEDVLNVGYQISLTSST